MRVKNCGEAPPGELIGRTTVCVECPETVAHCFAVARERPKPQECDIPFRRAKHRIRPIDETGDLPRARFLRQVEVIMREFTVSEGRIS